MVYEIKDTEKKWIERFKDFDGYRGVDFDKREKKYVLVEFPYPSGEGLHVGHAFSMTGADVYARFMRKKGFNVIFPMGFDAFGLPAENYAIKTGVQPQITTARVTKLFREQMDNLGFSFDWDRKVNTTHPDYYKWTQWIFVKLFEKGLAKKQEMPINWCPSCKIGLANEEVVDGKCERCGTETIKRNISQWVVKITDYADRLLDGLKDTDFIEKVKAAQVNWIGKKEGLIIDFKVDGQNKTISCFTKFPETIYGTGWVVVSPEYSDLLKLVTPDQKAFVEKYISETRTKSEFERTSGISEKTGVFTGSYVINPVNGKKVPVWVGDYVLANFGTGAVMGVGLHDKRDFMFAKKYGLEMIQVETLESDSNYLIDSEDKVIEDGVMINSEQFNGLRARDEAYEAISNYLVENKWATRKIEYHLRDWIFSRQHYWGEPIPMIDCSNCGWMSVPEEQLPVVLPEVEKYQPTETGESPLAAIESFVKTTCPKCGGEAKRETDTMPNWAGSDWYFLRYCDNKNDKVLADMEKMNYWLPVDVYVGGDEHNTLHLLYSRFIYQFLYDLGEVPKEHPEPYKKRLSHGVILAPDGRRMSKSKGNVISPDTEVEKYGADVLRTYMMFMGPFDATMAWNERALVGVKRFFDRFFDFVTETKLSERSDEKIKIIVNRLVMVAGDDFSQFKFNTVVARLMETLNALVKEKLEIGADEVKKLLIVLSHFAPFMTAEVWEKLGFEGSVHMASWPEIDESELVEKNVNLSVQVNGKLRGVLSVDIGLDEESVVLLAKQEENVAKYLNNTEIVKTIYIKGKTVNFVVK